MPLCCLWRNVDWLLVINTSSSSPRQRQTRRLAATSVNNLSRSVAAECIALGSRSQYAMEPKLAENRLSQLHSTPPLGGPRQNIATRFDMEKLAWCGLPDGAKNEDMFIRFQRIYERDGQTDGRTPYDGIGRACIASRAKIVQYLSKLWTRI